MSVQPRAGFRQALVRRVPASFVPFYQARGIRIDPAAAAAEQDAYAAALATAGLQVEWAEADPAFPDCVFLEDTFVLGAEGALRCRMAPHREGEQAGLIPILSRTRSIRELPRGARLDGGDVLHFGPVTWVGLSERTNRAGAAALQDFLAPQDRTVRTVPVERCLHLKTAITALDEDAVIVAGPWLDPALLEPAIIVETTPGEEGAANCLRLGRHLLVPAGHPVTQERIRRFAEPRGITLVPVPNRQFALADGGLTCRSLLW